MIAFPSQVAQKHLPQKTMVDTQCVFPHGKTGDVRVYLLTDNPAKAQSLGTRLQQYGLPMVRKFRLERNLTGAVVFNPWAPKLWDPVARQMMPRLIKFGDDLMVLSSADPEDVVRFARWLADKNAEYQKHKAKGPVSLKQLADEGEIETVYAD